MEKFSLDVPGVPVSVNVSHFNGQGGADEYHLALNPLKPAGFEVQADWLSRAYMNALDAIGIGVETAVFRRFFCSDLQNQSAILEKLRFSNHLNAGEPCAVSLVCQPPGPPSKISLWAYHVRNAAGTLDKIPENNSLSFRRGILTHHWTTGVTCQTADTPYAQTLGIFEKYEKFLQAHGISLADNVIRTWFFIQNIDVNYRGFVSARKEFFAAHGLTEKTHFIASTGVQGSHSDLNAKVAMDACAISGLSPGQVRFLAAPEHLSSTSVYGVTFERGTSIDYRDRKHVIISGTASIDGKGDILYQGNVLRQLDRTIENIEVLLKQAGAALKDMASFIAYVRDPVDYAVISQQMQERFGDVPVITVLAPVCRPGWLVEAEGIAVIPSSNSELPAF